MHFNKPRQSETVIGEKGFISNSMYLFESALLSVALGSLPDKMSVIDTRSTYIANLSGWAQEHREPVYSYPVVHVSGAYFLLLISEIP